MYKEQFEKGKKVVEQLCKEKMLKLIIEEVVKDNLVDYIQLEVIGVVVIELFKSKEDVFDCLWELGKLWDEGIFFEEEFQLMKVKLIVFFQ